MAGKTKRLTRRREILWHRDPHCQNCGVLTILPSQLAQKHGISPADLHSKLKIEKLHTMATIDHVVNRFESNRLANEGRERTRLYCWLCNNKRGAQDYATLSLEERQDRCRTGRKGPVIYEKKAEVAVGEVPNSRGHDQASQPASCCQGVGGQAHTSSSKYFNFLSVLSFIAMLIYTWRHK